MSLEAVHIRQRAARAIGKASGALSCLVSLFLLAPAGCQLGPRTVRIAPPGQTDIRAIWVTRWDYKSPADIAEVMENCRRGGFNTVLFQVRGHGTVAYRSRLEPWSEEFDGRDPGFDPLAVGCTEAHRRGLALHAWVNVMPGWRGEHPPSNPKQLYRAHPDWFLRDRFGRRQPLGWYSSLNPCYPEVRRYLASVMREIVTGYPVDGLHLDYIRFPNEWTPAYGRGRPVPDYPRDAKTLALFQRATRQTPESAPGVWDAWRTEQVAQTVREIRRMMRRVAPQVSLSAAVGADPEKARKEHFQDARRWITEGLLDAVFPMNYAADRDTFQRRLEKWTDVRSRVPIVTGIMFDERESAQVLRQLSAARRHWPHFAAFAYNSLFERRDAVGQPPRDQQSAKRSDRRKELLPHIARLAAWRR